mmetsp:Transcript_70570/g.204516  ORF Transcript_70570/g.204516 Transcript_70570/m.204516 type:complete len:205 (-) Transcript_70570:931-1545(-)
METVRLQLRECLGHRRAKRGVATTKGHNVQALQHRPPRASPPLQHLWLLCPPLRPPLPVDGQLRRLRQPQDVPLGHGLRLHRQLVGADDQLPADCRMLSGDGARGSRVEGLLAEGGRRIGGLQVGGALARGVGRFLHIVPPLPLVGDAFGVVVDHSRPIGVEELHHGRRELLWEESLRHGERPRQFGAPLRQARHRLVVADQAV